MGHIPSLTSSFTPASSMEAIGLLRSPTLCPHPSVALGNSLAAALGGVTDAADRDAFETIQRLRGSKTERIEGLRGVARLFVERPQLRDGLVMAVRQDPVASRSLDPWKDKVWLSTADSIMGLAESVPHVDEEALGTITAGLPSWITDILTRSARRQAPGAEREPLNTGQNPVDEIRGQLAQAFKPALVEALKGSWHSDDEQWAELRSLVWAFHSASSYESKIVNMTLRYRIQYTAMVFRALRRLEQSLAVAEETIERMRFKVANALYLEDGGLRWLEFSDYMKLWEEIHAETPRQDPLERIQNPHLGNTLCRRLSKWITKAHQAAKGMSPDSGDQNIASLMDTGRGVAAFLGIHDDFADVLAAGGNIYEDWLPALSSFVTAHKAAVEAVRTGMPRTWKREHRIITYNPYAIEDDKVMHRSFGEGTVLGPADSRGMVEVRFDGSGDRLRLMASQLVFASDRDAFLEAIEERVVSSRDHIRHIWRRVLRRQLARNDPAFALLDQGSLYDAGMELGFDPVAWGMRMTSGRYPDEVIPVGHERSYRQKKLLRRFISPDLIRGAMWFRPWQEGWKDRGEKKSPFLSAAGRYYPTYYRGERDRDLTDLYFAYRDGDSGAFRGAVELMRPLVDAWANSPARKGEGLLVPMIGTAPNSELAEELMPSHFPWWPRPEGYGEGVEGKTLAEKMEMVSAALRIDPELTEPIVGRSVLVVDDNVTDFATWMVARRLLFEAGAAEVGLAALTETVRDPRELGWALR